MAKPKYTTHLGMVDILPDESPKWRALEQIIHEEAASSILKKFGLPSWSKLN
jgi:histidyl-tRNA synthetase